MRNPVRLLQEAPARVLSAPPHDRELVARAEELEAEVAADLERPYGGAPLDPAHPVAFLCAEYGVHVSLPVYSGGLGALAGDLLKEASDQAVPLVAVGLMYRKGYFRQRIDASGWQHEYWVDTDPDRLPAALVTGPDGSPLTITVPIGDNDVVARIWRVDVGRVPLFLLDTDCPENGPLDRWITGRLYDGDPQTRLAQYALLGVGGVRALRALGYEPGVIHLNEGHAALAPLELARGTARPTGCPARRAGACPQPDRVHHPHAGARRQRHLSGRGDRGRRRPPGGRAGVLHRELLALGHDVGADARAPFGVTQAALRMSRAANAVSRRHGEVAREMWQSLWPDRSLDEIPIGHVTNGVHVPTWIGRPMRELLDRHLPSDWCERAAEPAVWAAVDPIPAEELWQTRRRQRTDLVAFVRARSVADRLFRGDLRDYVDAAARAFDPEVLTIGFARRVATYKRLDLLTRDPDWTLRCSTATGPSRWCWPARPTPATRRPSACCRPVRAQGRPGRRRARRLPRRLRPGLGPGAGARLRRLAQPAAPAAGGQRDQRDEVRVQRRPPAQRARRVVGRGLRRHQRLGDPRRGGPDHHAQDERDAGLPPPARGRGDARVLRPGRVGLPSRWIELIRASLRTLGPMFCASRMLAQYVEGPYRG